MREADRLILELGKLSDRLKVHVDAMNADVAEIEEKLCEVMTVTTQAVVEVQGILIAWIRWRGSPGSQSHWRVAVRDNTAGGEYTPFTEASLVLRLAAYPHLNELLRELRRLMNGLAEAADGDPIRRPPKPKDSAI